MPALKRIARIFSRARLRGRAAWWALISPHKLSFSQCGEDVIAGFLLNQLGIQRPLYLDIGAHHPIHLSNTALFCLQGGRGINIEPDPRLFGEFVRHRPRDINLNIGIGAVPGNLTFFRMADPALSTFSHEEATRIEEEEGIPIKERLSLPVRPIAEVLREYNFFPNFVSIDVEGKDLEVLEGFEFNTHMPEAICVETLSFSLKQAGRKSPAITTYMAQHGYDVYADTYINTIFVRRDRFTTMNGK